MASFTDTLYAALDQWGLGSLAPIITQAIINKDDELTIVNKIREQDAYKARFPAMPALQAKAKAGGYFIDEGNYLTMERAYRNTFAMSGLPTGMWDSPDDFKRLIENDINIDEVQRRVDAAKMAVQSTDPNTRAELQRLYGITDMQLVAYALDPDKNSEYLQKVATTAQLAGFSKTAGISDIAKASWEGYAQDLINQQATESQMRDMVSTADILGEQQGRLAGLEGEQFTTEDAMDIAIRRDSNKTLASQRRVEKEKARFSGTQGVGTGSLAGSGI